MGRRARGVARLGRDRGTTLTRLLFDTTFLIDAERAASNLDELIDDEDDAALATISVAEFKVGIELAQGKRRLARTNFLSDLLAVLPVIDHDLAVAGAHARLLVAVRRQGRPRGAHDLVIAATALVSNREVMTADAKAFADLPGIDVRSHR